MKRLFVVALLACMLLGSVYAQVSTTQTSFGYGTGSRTGTARIVSTGSFASASSVYGADASVYWPTLGDADQCEARTDLLLQLSPLGCEPAVVSSSLLAEQDVPVFCKVDGLKLNPLIDIQQVKNIRFTGDLPPEVRSIGFQPARAAIRSTTQLTGSPYIDNIGYVVVVLKRQPNEALSPEVLELSLTGQIDYQAANTFGVGRAEFLLSVQDEDDFFNNKYQSSFWQGDYALKLNSADANQASVTIFDQNNNPVATRSVNRGQLSTPIYVPGQYCRGRMSVVYDGLQRADKLATIRVNDDVYQLTEGSRFLNNKCRVTTINALGTRGGTAEVQCGAKQLELTLGVTPLEIGDTVTLVTDDNGQDDGWEILGITGNVAVIEKGTLQLPVLLNEIYVNNQQSLFEADYSNKEENVETYFSLTKQQYTDLAEDYTNERRTSEDDPFGQQGLANAILLAQILAKQSTQVELMELHAELYPTHPDTAHYLLEIARLNKINLADAAQSVFLDNEYQILQLTSISVPEERSKGVFDWGALRVEVAEDDGEQTTNGLLEVTRIVSETRVSVRTTCADGTKTERTLTANQANPPTLCGSALHLRDVDFSEIAKLHIETSSGSLSTEVEFSVGIGIEQRDIQLNPARAAERIANLDETLDQWQSVEENLGNIVTGYKAACFATMGVLTLKNLLAGLSGEALARQQTMQGTDGWSQQCQELVNQGEYNTVTSCLNANSGAIENEVNARQGCIEAVNDRISSVEASGEITTNEFLNTRVNVEDAKAAYRTVLINTYGGAGGNEFINNLGNLDLSAFSYADLRAMDMELCMQGQGSTYTARSQALFSEVQTKVEERQSIFEELEQARGASEGIGPLQVASIGATARNAMPAIGKVYAIGSSGQIANGDTIVYSGTNAPYSGSSDGIIFVSGRALGDGSVPESFAVLGTRADGVLQAQEIYYYERAENGDIVLTESFAPTGSQSQNVQEFINDFGISGFQDVPSDTYQYPIKASSREVKYFESAPYEGLPALVPFDFQRGYYVKVEPIIGVGSNIASYTEAGEPRSFKICNVGPNGLIGDEDPCQRVDVGISDNGQVFGLSATKSSQIIHDAKSALIEAAQQYGNEFISIFDEQLRRGTPANAVSKTACQEFMSPGECQLLFNACDPVICPPSRCDFGGNYQVADVVRTGIVGGALLCLPNINEGVYVPVCLSGIHAGIQGYTSILESHRACLQESIDTGQLTGICDEITSVNTCKLFWEPAISLAEIVVPRLFSGFSGARGGGEYATGSAVIQNVENSVDFFTQEYAVNAISAYNVRSIEEAGSPLCQGFISGSFPIGADFQALIEPDSPHQFHAYFSSSPFSDAIPPPTSRYKVFYHIFAGDDQGVNYQVYLKDPPQGGTFGINPTASVASGFIPRGEFATESRDLTLPSGYQQLCVSINGVEECGFEQVTTSFAIEQLRDAFVAEELTNADITSEQECISGPTLQPTNVPLTLNPQQAVEELVNPQVFEQGIVRICSNVNPGSATDPTRYVDVGYCGDDTVTCWLDKRSVDDALSSNQKITEGLKNQTLSELQAIQRSELDKRAAAVDPNIVYGQIDELRSDLYAIRTPETFSLADYEVILDTIQLRLGGVILQEHVAARNLLIGDVYAVITDRFHAKSLGAVAVTSESSSTSEDSSDNAPSEGNADGITGNGIEVSTSLAIFEDGEYTGYYIEQGPNEVTIEKDFSWYELGFWKFWSDDGTMAIIREEANWEIFPSNFIHPEEDGFIYFFAENYRFNADTRELTQAD